MEQTPELFLDLSVGVDDLKGQVFRNIGKWLMNIIARILFVLLGYFMIFKLIKVAANSCELILNYLVLYRFFIQEVIDSIDEPTVRSCIGHNPLKNNLTFYWNKLIFVISIIYHIIIETNEWETKIISWYNGLWWQKYRERSLSHQGQANQFEIAL